MRSICTTIIGLMCSASLYATSPDSRYETLQLSRFDEVGEEFGLSATFDQTLKVRYMTADEKEIQTTETQSSSSLSATLKTLEVSNRGYATAIQLTVVEALARTTTYPDAKNLFQKGYTIVIRLKDSERIFTQPNGVPLNEKDAEFFENFISLDQGNIHQDLFGPARDSDISQPWIGNQANCQKMLKNIAKEFPHGFVARSCITPNDQKKLSETVDGIEYVRVVSQIVANDMVLENDQVKPKSSQLLIRTGIRIPRHGESNALWTSASLISIDMLLDTQDEDNTSILVRQTTQIKQQSMIAPFPKVKTDKK